MATGAIKRLKTTQRNQLATKWQPSQAPPGFKIGRLSLELWERPSRWRETFYSRCKSIGTVQLDGSLHSLARFAAHINATP